MVVSSIILPVFSSCGFTLICEKDENRLVAENVLNLIIRHLQEYCQILLQPSEVHCFCPSFTRNICLKYPAPGIQLLGSELNRTREKPAGEK